MYNLRPTSVCLHFLLSLLDGIEKQGCGQEVCAATRRYLQSQQLAVETLQVLPSDCGSTTPNSFHRSGTFLCSDECRLPAAIQQACVIQTGDDAQQCVETGHMLRRTARTSPTKHRQTYIQDMRKAAKSFTARTRDTILLRDYIPM
jgi:hypothetical protein